MSINNVVELDPIAIGGIIDNGTAKLMRQTDADVALALEMMAAATERNEKVIKIAPSTITPTAVIDACLDVIKPGQRVLITLPRCFTNFGGEGYDPDAIGEIVSEYNSPEISANEFFPGLPHDIFLTLRCNMNGEIVVDICHL